MNKSNLEKEYRKSCISCYITRKVIEEYGQIYEMKREDIEQNENKRLIEELAKILAIPGELMEKYAVLKRLSKSRPEDSSELLRLQNKNFDETQDDKCLVNLQKIITAIKCFYGDDIENICDKVQYKGEILSLIHEENQGKEDIYKERYDEEKGKKALKEYNAKRKSEDGTKEIAKGLEYIFNFYKNSCINFYDMYNREKCFFKIVNIIKDENEEKKTLFEEGMSYFKRVSLLSQDKQKIIWDFLNHMPKNFGYNLKAIMRYKNMTENDIANLIPSKTVARTIQALTENQKRPKEDELLSYLCKALLVSEEVLLYGKGKSYGNWKLILSNEGLNALQKAIKNDNEFKEKVSLGTNSVKEFTRNEIIKIINEDYEEVIKKYPEFFEEDDFEVYENDEELFSLIIDKKYAYILLDVLERID